MSTVPELIALFSSHQLYLERLAAGMGNRAATFVENANERIMKVVNNLPKSLTPERQTAIRKQIREIINEEFNTLIADMKSEQKELGGYEAGWVNKTVNAEIESSINTVVPSMTQIATAAAATPIHVGNGRYTTYGKMFSDFARDRADVMDGLILNGFVNGQTTREISELIESEMGTWEQGSASKARMLARTGTNHYATEARLTYGKGNEDIIVGWRSVGTLDSRTSEICRSLDGVVMKESDKRFGNFKPPRHPNCRSTLVMEIDPKLKYDDSSAQRPSNFTVGDSKDFKRVSSQRTYYEELKRLSARDQDIVLGPTLGRAFRKMDDPAAFAKLTVDQKTLAPLTIEQMKQRDNELSRILRSQQRRA